MGYFDDDGFRDRLLALLIQNRKFLRRMSGLLTAKDFQNDRSEDPLHWAREWTAYIALKHWKDYGQPVSGLLKTEALDYIREHRTAGGRKNWIVLGQKQREALLTLVERLRDPELAVAQSAMEEKVIAYKQRQAMGRGITELITLKEKGELTQAKFGEVARHVLEVGSGASPVVDYGKTLEQRIRRRELEQQDQYPHLFIDCIDSHVRTIPRGQIALLLAKYGIGKSIGLCHVAKAHALQGYHVVFFTLEDPRSVMEDRLDASLAEISMEKLPVKSELLRKRWAQAWQQMRGRIHVVDGTGGGWSVQRMRQTCDDLRNRGIPVDVVIVDYDEKIDPPFKYRRGEAASIKRMESNDVYQEMTNWAAQEQIYLWTAAQAKRSTETQMIVAGDDAAEDISKLRIVAFCIGIGVVPPASGGDENSRFLYIAKHRFGKSRIGWPIQGDFAKSIFYDPDESAIFLDRWTAQQLPRRKVRVE